MSRLICIGLLLFISGIQTLSAQFPLDASFGENGIRLIEQAKDMIVLSDGNILVFDDLDQDTKIINVLAFDEHGNAQETFGENGLLKLQLGDKCIFRMAIAADNNEWYMWVGYPNNYYSYDSIIRYNEQGERIKEYGINGAAPLPLHESYVKGNMRILRSGELIVTGELASFDPYIEGRFVCKFTEAGVLDQQFGNSGIVMLNDYNSWVTKRSIFIERSDGSILVGNTVDNGFATFVEVRLLTKWGVRINSFGAGGSAMLLKETYESELYSYLYDEMSEVLYVLTYGFYADEIRVWQINWDGDFNELYGHYGYKENGNLNSVSTMYKLSDGNFYFTGNEFIDNHFQHDISVWKTSPDLAIIPWSSEDVSPDLNLLETADKLQASNDYEIRSVMLQDGSILIMSEAIFYGEYYNDFPEIALIKLNSIDVSQSNICPLLSAPVLYSDPVQSSLQLILDPSASSSFTFSVTDMMGRTVIPHYTVALEPGFGHYTYPIPAELPKGMYLLTIHADNCATGIKFVK